jgi:predicted site-specific integrase-resolvase
MTIHYTPKQVAAKIGVDTSLIHRFIRQGRLAAEKLGPHVTIISAANLKKFLKWHDKHKRKRKKVAEDALIKI